MKKEPTTKTMAGKRKYLKGIVGDCVDRLTDEQIIWVWTYYVTYSFKAR